MNTRITYPYPKRLVNICMIVRDRPKLTRQSIESLFVNTPFNMFNLTVIDDQSQLETQTLIEGLAIAKSFYANRTKESLGVGASRNLSIQESSYIWGRGGYLYVTDNDVYFRPDWLPPLLANFACAEKLGFRLLGAYNHPYHKPAGWEKDGKGVTFPGVDGYELHSNYSVGSLSWLMRWETWDKYGPLTEGRRGINQSEDVEFGNRIRSDGFLIGKIFPHTVVNCGVTGTFGDACPGADWVEKEMGEGVYFE